MNIPVRIRSNGLVGILISVQLMPILGQPQLGINAKGELIEGGPKQQGLQPFGVIVLRDGFAVGPLGDMQPLDQKDIQQAMDEARAADPSSEPPPATSDSINLNQHDLDAQPKDATNA